MSNDITEVRLLSVPLENDYKHTFYFNNATSQESYFKGKTRFSKQDFSYQRKEGFIRYPAHFDKLTTCNYLMYKNTNDFNDKWYYAFITRMEYKNDETTFIYFETDVIQTFMFDYQIKSSFVEREHVIDDTAGAHTLPENLETGEYICNGVVKYNSLSECGIVLATTLILETSEDYVHEENKLISAGGGGKFNNIYSGMRYYYFENKTDPNASGEGNLPTIYDLNSVIMYAANFAQSDGLISMFYAPKNVLMNNYRLSEVQYYSADTPFHVCQILPSENEFYDLWQAASKPTELNGYTPRNKKLLAYPFSYLNVDNNGGAAVTYKYELFSSPNAYFVIEGALCPGGSIKLSPYAYNGVLEGINYSEGLTGAKLPICNWTTDVYTNWLTQNAINEKAEWINMFHQGGQQVGGGAVQAGGWGALQGGIQWSGDVLMTINNQVARKEIHSLIPPTVNGNVNAGDVNFASGNSTFIAYKMSVKKEYAKIIDGYFDMFGYQCNMVKIPNKEHRTSWWYTKTADINIDGNIPNEDIQKIKNCYNTGITFWKNPDKIGDYSQENGIVLG